MVTMKQRNKSKQPEPDGPVPSERHARHRVCDILWAPGSLPRDLDDWLHSESELLAERERPAGPGKQTRAAGDGGTRECARFNKTLFPRWKQTLGKRPPITRAGVPVLMMFGPSWPSSGPAGLPPPAGAQTGASHHHQPMCRAK